jgi:beta-lactamase class A
MVGTVGGVRRFVVAAVVATAAVAALVAGAPSDRADAAPPVAQPFGRAQVAESWRPDVAAARRYAGGRAGVVSFAVRTEGSIYGLRTRRTYASASVVKAMLLVAYLNDRRVRGRSLRRDERSLLSLLVRHSSNRAATRVRDFVGNGALERLADRAGMRDFATTPSWGSTRIAAADQARFMLAIDRLTVRRHRSAPARLLGSIVRAQRWGVAEAVPPGWSLSFKSGWLKGTEHQIAQLRRGDRRIAIAILADEIPLPSHAYGKRTMAGVAKRLLRDLGPDSVPR